jgi:hypothetical protein
MAMMKARKHDYNRARLENEMKGNKTKPHAQQSKWSCRQRKMLKSLRNRQYVPY